MGKWILVVVLAFAGLSASHQFWHQDLCEGFLPENDMNIPMGWDLRAGGISEQEFNDVLDRIEALYKPEVAAHKATLTVNRLWSNGTVNASANRVGNSWQINMYGGLARHPSVTADGFALVACHEMGHHLGGAPKVGGFMNKWASNEGASDYYATLKCLRRLFENDDNERILSEMQIDPAVPAACEAEHGSRREQLLCIRGAMAGLSVSGMFNSLSKGGKLSFTTPDPSQVRKTNSRHPAAQCRLDTYYAGALCRVPVSQAVSDRNYRDGSCADPVVHTRGMRPRCWFKPDERARRGAWDLLPAS